MLDRAELIGPLFIAPAILYVVLLVALPFLLAIYYSVSAYTIFNPSYPFVGLKNFLDVHRERHLPPDAGQHLHLHDRARRSSALLLGKIGAMLLMQDFPRPRHRPRADRAAVGGAGVARDAGLAVDVRFALQRHQLDAGGGRPDRPGEPAAMAGRAGPGHAGGHRPSMPGGCSRSASVIFLAGYLGAAGRARRRHDRRRRLLAAHLLRSSCRSSRRSCMIALIFGTVFTFTDMSVVYLLTRGGPINSTQVLGSLGLPGRHPVGRRRPRRGDLPVPVPVPAGRGRSCCCASLRRREI